MYYPQSTHSHKYIRYLFNTMGSPLTLSVTILVSLVSDICDTRPLFLNVHETKTETVFFGKSQQILLLLLLLLGLRTPLFEPLFTWAEGQNKGLRKGHVSCEGPAMMLTSVSFIIA